VPYTSGFRLEKDSTVDADYFRSLYDYLCWSRDKVLDGAEGLSREDYVRDVGLTYQSLRGILTHTLGGEAIWLSRATGEPPEPFVREDDVPTLAALRERWDAEISRQRRLMASLTDAAVMESVAFKTRDGTERTLARWQILTMQSIHTIQHRSEAAEALTMLGHSPGDMDFVLYVWDGNRNQQ
jgi:uncharacterized damage-inducible protein DinB